MRLVNTYSFDMEWEVRQETEWSFHKDWPSADDFERRMEKEILKARKPE